MRSLNIKKVKNWSARTSQEKLAVVIIKLLNKAGFSNSFIVGGYVRDLLLKRKETGLIDIATEASPAAVIRIMQKNNLRVIPTGLKHGTVTVHQGKSDIEITTFRKEGKYLDLRRPSRVSFIKDPKADSARRDFTVNSFYFNPLTREILDFQGGFSDLHSKNLRFVGSAEKRIEEDALRLLRAVRFATVLDFKISAADKKNIRDRAALLQKISAERIKQELDKIMLSPRRSEGIRMLYDLGLVKQIMPELEILVNTSQSKNYHSEGNVLVHTILALKSAEPGMDLNTLYGILFHDIGKAATAKRTRRDGRVHYTYYSHQPLGAEIAQKVLKRLKFSNNEIDDVCWYVKNHLVPFELSKMRFSKQMAWALEPRFENLLKLFRADVLASVNTDKRGKVLKPSFVSYDYSKRVLKKARSQPALQKPLVSGLDVMRALKISQGPQVGQILAKVREEQLAGKLKSKKQALRFLAKY